jgi:hypothetical protein
MAVLQDVDFVRAPGPLFRSAKQTSFFADETYMSMQAKSQRAIVRDAAANQLVAVRAGAGIVARAPAGRSL